MPIKSSRKGEQVHKHFSDDEGIHHAILIDDNIICSTVIAHSEAALARIAAARIEYQAIIDAEIKVAERKSALIAKLGDDTITDPEVKELLKINNGLWTPP